MDKYYDKFFPTNKKKYIDKNVFNRRFKLNMKLDKKAGMYIAIISELISVDVSVRINLIHFICRKLKMTILIAFIVQIES